MSWTLNSLKGGYIGDYVGDRTNIGVMKGDTGIQTIAQIIFSTFDFLPPCPKLSRPHAELNSEFHWQSAKANAGI